MDESAGKQGGKPRRPRAVNAPRAAERPAASKVKSTIHLTVEASQRLDIHCTMGHMDRSEMVEKLINDHLRRYVVSDRGGTTLGVVSEGEGEARRSA